MNGAPPVAVPVGTPPLTIDDCCWTQSSNKIAFDRTGSHMVSGLLSITIPFPVGGRCLLYVYWRVADQPCVGGSVYWRSRAWMPATGVEATALASASSVLA